jgi:transcriptional regulator with XRE-family HTH domain
MMQHQDIPLTARAVLAANIKRLRHQHGISQEALADLAHLHRTYIGSIERQERNLSLDNVERIARVLGVHITVLLMEPDDDLPNKKES